MPDTTEAVAGEQFRQALTRIQPGDHICCLYSADSDYDSQVCELVQSGLERGEQVLFLHGAAGDRCLLERLSAGPVDVERLRQDGQLQVQPALAPMQGQGQHRLDLDAYVSWLARRAAASRAAGWPLLRYVADMDWALSGRPGTEDLLDMEAALDTLVQDQGLVGFCLFDRRRFSAQFQLGIIQSHRALALEGQVYANPYHVAPALLRGRQRWQILLESWLAMLPRQLAGASAGQRRERQAQALADGSADPLLLLAPDGTVLAANRAAVAGVGLPSYSGTAAGVCPPVPPDVAPALRREAGQVARSGRPADFVASDRDGTVHYRLSPVLDAAGRTWAVAACDRTRQVSCEEQRQRATEELATRTAELNRTSAALQLLLDHSSRQRQQLEERFVADARTQLGLTLQRLRRTGLSAEQARLVDRLGEAVAGVGAAPQASLSARFPALTSRELEVARLIRSGRSTKEIADLLALSPETVRYHRKQLRTKLGLRRNGPRLTVALASLEAAGTEKRAKG